MAQDTPATPDNIDQLSFEQALEELEAVIDRIETGEVGLEESLAQYESGMAMVKRCRSILDRTEKRIAELTHDENGNLAIQNDD